jgi:hypothetical protein
VSIAVAAARAAAAEPELDSSSEFATFQHHIDRFERTGELGDALCVLAVWCSLRGQRPDDPQLTRRLDELRHLVGDTLTAGIDEPS